MAGNNSDYTELNSSNSTEKFDTTLTTFFSAYECIQIVECVMMNVTNIALVFVILTSSPLKRPLRNGMLGAVTVANLVTGLCVVPLGIFPRNSNACLLEKVAYEFVVYMESSVQLWTLVLLLLHHLTQLLDWKIPPAWWNSGRLNQYLLRAAGFLYVLHPWLVAVSVVSPMVNSFDDYEMFGDFCNVGYIDSRHALTLLVMPATLIVVLGTVLAAVRLTCGKERRRPTPALTSQSSQSAEAVNTSRLRLTPDEDDDVLDPDPTYVHVLVGLTTVLLLLPSHARKSQIPEDFEDFKLYMIILYSFYLVNDLAPTVQALLWLLLLPDLRTRLQQAWAALIGRLPCKHESPPLSTSGGVVPPVRFATLTIDEG